MFHLIGSVDLILKIGRVFAKVRRGSMLSERCEISVALELIDGTECFVLNGSLIFRKFVKS